MHIIVHCPRSLLNHHHVMALQPDPFNMPFEAKGWIFTISPSIPSNEPYIKGFCWCHVSMNQGLSILMAGIFQEMSAAVVHVHKLQQWCNSVQDEGWGEVIADGSTQQQKMIFSWLPRDPKALKHHPHPSCGKIMDIDHPGRKMT